MTKTALNAATGKIDPLFPSIFFAKIPAEVLGPLAHIGPAAMSHAEFRVFVALCRFRGTARIVNPTRARLEMMTGLTPNNISRATRGLCDKGWLTIHYADGKKSRKVANYELHISTDKRRSGRVDGEAPKVKAGRCTSLAFATGTPPQDAVDGAQSTLTALATAMVTPIPVAQPMANAMAEAWYEPEASNLSDGEFDEILATKIDEEF